MNDLEGSVGALKKAHSLSPQDPLVLINYAVVLHLLDKVKEVKDILTELNDIMAVIDVDSQVSEKKKNLVNSIYFIIENYSFFFFYLISIHTSLFSFLFTLFILNMSLNLLT